ncbi:DUF305 domain-containing protein [Actinoplanes sp. DH11]|uniref:DUF305 domain-containing protein n=1 Tax=Actinoplanes sp. DH11 TaxID=2857011 RepID=UPI001E37C669|nr:DUF305 domain-containing protein [Actinoplanes sp. DH11]
MPAHHRAFFTAILAAGLTAGLTAGCAGRQPAPEATALSSAPAAPPAGAPLPSALSASFSTTDTAWLEITIAMNEQLLPLLDLTSAHGREPGLKELSEQVRMRTMEELTELRRLHTEAGLPAENPHKGMPMPGMVTPEQVAEAAALTGDAFDAVLRTRLTEHLQQGQSLLLSLLKTDSPPPIATVAERVKLNREFAVQSLRWVTENPR